jgi:hypothetical protein
MLLVVGVIVAVFWARSTLAQYGDAPPTSIERTIALEAPAAPAEGGTITAAAAAGSSEPLRLNIDLEEGLFIIRPGPPGDQVRIEGRYPEGRYELTERHEPATAGGSSRTTIRFRSKVTGLARFIAGIGGGSENRPTVTVTIPTGAPIDLSLRVAMGESQLDFGGLTLSELGLDLSMGRHQVDFSRPLGEGLRRVSLNAGMGNVSVDNLGNARASVVDTTGSMGNLTADLGGAWQPGSSADLSFTHSMGQLTVRVPNGVRLETTASGADEQPADRPDGAGEAAGPDAPALRLRMTTSMGEGRVVRY